jgi:hypothetical protein
MPLAKVSPMSRRLVAVAATLLAGGLASACHYGDDGVVPPPAWWTGDAGADTTTAPTVDSGLADAPATEAGHEADVLDAPDAEAAADGAYDAGEGGPCGPVINEVMMHGATSDDEFVELYNSCATPLVFDDGWTIATPTNGGFGQSNVVALAGKTLPGNGYLLFVGNGYAGVPLADGLLSDGTDQLSSSGGAVALFHTGARVDSVGWGALSRADFVEGSATVTPPANGKSLGRHPNGFDSNVNTRDFATDLTPTPRAANP